MKKTSSLKIFNLFPVFLCFLTFFNTLNAQSMDRIERERMKSIVENLKSAIKDDYYDPNFHGIDLEARAKQAKARIEEVPTTGQALGVIAQFLIDFDDSHLYFLPPGTNLEVEYGWRLQMYGDRCYVIAVQPKSDAEAKGLKPGDQVLAIENFRPLRKELWKIGYYYNNISKRPKIKLKVLGPTDETPRVLEIDSKITKHPIVINNQTIFLDQDYGGYDLIENKFLTVGNTTIWKMPTFAIDPKEIGSLVSRVQKSTSLILDLRQNGGGYVKTLEALAGYIFDKNLKIADLKGRKPMDPSESKTKGKDCFTGKLIVLVDANSGSAAEIFARLVQLEKRGIVLGDVSSGSVMQARGFSGTIGADTEIWYGASITNADVIMSDGKSLEHVGVIPDEMILPSATDLANRRDPVLSRAVEILGGKLSAEDAGKFSIEFLWRESKGRFRLFF
jgi:carboxyl-terminal processing protease